MLDRTERRIVGVLLEKELAVPDTYPLTANALMAGCNQKSNREPEMSLEQFELDGVLMALQLSGWVVKIEGGRADRYRHEVDKKLGLSPKEKAILAELLVRGSQAAGALKTRVGRMGFHGSVEEVVAVLEAMRDKPSSLVELLPRRPRERDCRWAHKLAPTDEAADPTEQPDADEPTNADSPTLTLKPKPVAAPPTAETPDLEQRITQLEESVAALTDELRTLRSQLGA